MLSKTRKRSCLGWVGKIFLGLLGLLLGLIIFGLIREMVTRSRYRGQFPPPGQIVSLPTHDMHLHCVGTGSPTVVFEADLDQYGSLSWYSVQGEVGKITRACSYDRAGILWSKPGPRPRDGETVAGELAAVLAAAGEMGPFVLVGHAFGGAYVRIFAGQHLEQVCGVVLLESSHPEMLTRFEEVGLSQDIPDKRIRPLIFLLSHLGSPGRYKGNIYNLPLEVYNPIQAYLPGSSLAWYDENVESSNTLAQAGVVESLGDIPLIVVASATPPTSIGDQGGEFHELWLELQQDLTALSDNSEIRVYEIGHYPQFQSPALVIEAVEDVIERCRTAGE